MMMSSFLKEDIMSILESVFLAGFVSTFCAMGAVIAYGQRQTELAARERREAFNIAPPAGSSSDELLSPPTVLAARLSA
jgi:hypothetical protein